MERNPDWRLPRWQYHSFGGPSGSCKHFEVFGCGGDMEAVNLQSVRPTSIPNRPDASFHQDDHRSKDLMWSCVSPENIGTQGHSTSFLVHHGRGALNSVMELLNASIRLSSRTHVCRKSFASSHIRPCAQRENSLTIAVVFTSSPCERFLTSTCLARSCFDILGRKRL